ncbi:MAG: isoleucine--tRNA ligase [Candidatus Sumerlaeaceae bacterium]
MTTEPTRTDYKATICLPQTGFAMRANLNQREPEILARWKKAGLQKQLAQKESPRGDFILHDGPPYANGPIHLGHALNKLLKDILVRHRTMAGYRAPYVPGWDCHGLPIEQKVGSELGRKKADMTPLQIRKLCAEYARKWIKAQGEAFERLGIGGEWDRPYLTLDPQFEVGELETLKQLVDRGYVYKGLKPVFWCASCQTALADAEVEYADHTSPSIYVKFPVIAPEKNPATADLLRPSVVIWTTTPWTLPANMAVALHPDFEYVALRVPAIDGSGEEDYILAKELVGAFQGAVGIDRSEVVKELRARDLENLEMEHPVQPDRKSRLILGDHVTLEAGTGAVHTAPGHGMEDFIVGKKYGMEPIVPVDHAGRFTNEFSLMEGMAVWEANAPIIRYLDEKNLLVKHEPYVHSYPHCWRCHNPIIYRATEQWFMNVDHEQLRDKTLQEIDSNIVWIPSWGRDRIHNMMVARPDWCLSRQRVWGVPIPAVVCTGCRKASLSPAIIEKFQAVVAQRGSDAWWEDDVTAFLPDAFRCPECGAAEFEKESNILDVWFDSGSSHEPVLNRGVWPELRWPADLYLEGSDQHRGWFHTSLLTSMGTHGKAPYKSVLTHGFVLDGKGEAMSKSKGNVIAPAEVIKEYGADVLRLWVASEDYRTDVKLSKEILTRVAEAYRRIRNTLRYLLGNVADFDPEADAVPFEQLLEIDRWILHELHTVNATILKAYDDYEFHRIFHLATQFCVVQLSSVYLDITKDRMYCSGQNSPARRAAQTAQYAVADTLLRLLAPILVYTCDEAYLYLDTDAASIHLLPFNALPAQWQQPELAARWVNLLSVRDDVLRALEDARQVKKAIGQSLEAKVLVEVSDSSLKQLLRDAEGQLAELFITSQALVVEPQTQVSGDAISVVQGERANITVLPAEGSKCGRCWRILPDVGQDASHPGLCERCVDVLRRHY